MMLCASSFIVGILGIELQAQTLNLGQFGKNKVQYETFEWKFITSEHFNVYYHSAGLQYVAQFCAVKAEDALTSMEKNLNYRIGNKKINIIIYGSHNQFQQTNVISQFMPEGVGGVTELFKNRVVIPFEGNWKKFRHVIHHELVHAFLNEMFYGGSLQTAINSRTQIPLWMNEGLAEFESIGGLDVATDMFMRDLTLNEEIPELTELNGYFAYRGGQAFYAYVADRYGINKISELLQRLRIGNDPNQAFRSVFNLDVAEFSKVWQDAMKKQYYPDVDIYNKVDDYAKRLTNHKKDDNFYNTSPAISPKGDQVAFISDRDGQFGIYIMDIERKSEPRLLVSSQRSLDFEELNILTPGISWNPSGTRIAITAKSGGEDALYVIDIRNDKVDKFTFDLKTMTSANWSPDGKYIVIVAVADDQPDLYVFDTSTRKISKLTDDVFTDEHPTWSGDSRYVYFVSDRGNYIKDIYNRENLKIWDHDFEQSDIYRIDITSKKIDRITNDPDNDKSSLVISNDNSKMLFVADNNGIGNLYEMDLKSKKIRAKTNSVSALTQIALSRDESKLLFSAQNKGGFDLFMIRNPFELKLENELLVPTKYKQQILERTKLARSLTSDTTYTGESSRTTYTGYGNFSVEFSRQQFIAPTKVKSASKEAQGTGNSTSDEFTPQDYVTTLSTDLMLGGAGYNALWGNLQSNIQMLFSDLLGDHQIYVGANLWLDLNNSNILVQYSYLPKPIDYIFTIQHNALLWGLPNGSIARNRNYGITVTSEYAWSRFQRFELSARWMGVDREDLLDPTSVFPSLQFLLPSARYVFDNTEFGYIAPFRGTRLFTEVQLSPFTKLFTTFNTDIRTYMPVHKYLYGFALRFAGGASIGADPRSFFLGGPDLNWINRRIAGNSTMFDRPEDFAFLQFAMPMRGFEFGSASGTKYFITNAEFRFPLLQALLAGVLPLPAFGSIFTDFGSAFNGNLSDLQLRAPIYANDDNGNRRPLYDQNTLFWSMGLGIRTFVLNLPLKIDIAWRRDSEAWSPPNYLFSLGVDF